MTTTDLMSYTAAEWDVFMSGYRSGYGHGLDAGRIQADADAAALHRAAVRIVRSLSNVPPHAALVANRRRHQDEAGERSVGARRAWRQETAS